MYREDDESPRPVAIPRAGRNPFKRRGELSVQWARDIERVPITWLWKPYLQSGAVNLLTGDPGTGKSTVICALAAGLTRGDALPGQDPLPPMNCWIMNGEDNAEDTIVWRLGNQGADLSRVLVTDMAREIDSEIAMEIAATVTREQIGFLSIDPYQSWISKDMDMNRANETRAWGNILRKIARDTGVCILLARHRRKAAQGEKALYAGIGSIDLVGAARSEISTFEANGQTVLQRTKGNVGVMGQGLTYLIESSTEPGNDHGVLSWGLPYVPSKRGTKGGEPTAVPKQLAFAVEWLKEQLSGGPVDASVIMRRAVEVKISETTLKRAKKGLVDSVQVGPSKWQWALSTQVC